MTWGAVAVGVGTLGAGYMSSEASKDAADAGADAAGRSSQQVKEAADQARREVKQYIPAAQKDLLAGYSAAADIFGQGIPEQQRLLSGGNMNAQQTVAGGYDQYKNALMGLPVDQSSWQPQMPQMSQAPQNPFTQDMFNDITEVPIQADQRALSGLTSNRDVLDAIESGDLDFNGIDTNWFRSIEKDSPGWLNSSSMLGLSRLSPSDLNTQLQGGWPVQESRERYGNLIRELSRLGGVTNKNIPGYADTVTSYHNTDSSKNQDRGMLDRGMLAQKLAGRF